MLSDLDQKKYLDNFSIKSEIKSKESKKKTNQDPHLMITDLAMHFDELNEYDPGFREGEALNKFLNDNLAK